MGDEGMKRERERDVAITEGSPSREMQRQGLTGGKRAGDRNDRKEMAENGDR